MGSSRTFIDVLKMAQMECENALSEFLGTEVGFKPTDFSERRAEELLTVVGQFSKMDEVSRATVVGVYGDLQGYLIMLLPVDDAERLTAYMLDGETDPEMQESVLAEIGNLTTARLLMGISKGFKLNGEALPTPHCNSGRFLRCFASKPDSTSAKSRSNKGHAFCLAILGSFARQRCQWHCSFPHPVAIKKRLLLKKFAGLSPLSIKNADEVLKNDGGKRGNS